jgi:hypothetical protein
MREIACGVGSRAISSRQLDPAPRRREPPLLRQLKSPCLGKLKVQVRQAEDSVAPTRLSGAHATTDPKPDVRRRSTRARPRTPPRRRDAAPIAKIAGAPR